MADAVSLLLQIHDKEKNWNVSVLVSHMSHFRGGTDEGPLKHTDLVVLHQEGNHMYAQLPLEAANRLQHSLEEGKVFLIRKFLCNPAKPVFRAVESPYMMQFTRFSMTALQPGLEDAFPYCTYSLSLFADIPGPASVTPHFIDVIGKIVAVSDVVPVQSYHQEQPSDTRTVVLTDLRVSEIRLVHWGNCANEFPTDEVLAMSEKAAVIAIFVGTLPKRLKGVLGLSGSIACRWYIDEDLPNINSFCNSLGPEFAHLAAFAPPEQGNSSYVHEDPVEKTVKELLDLDPFENLRKQFIYTVTVTRLGTDLRWWFLSCSLCRKGAVVYGAQY